MSERKWWSSSSGRIVLQLAADDARSGSHSGPCDDDVRELSRKSYIAKQLAELDAILLARELREWGAWSDTELEDHDQNLQRVLWLACGGIEDERI